MIRLAIISGLVVVLACVIAVGGENEAKPISDGDFSLYPGSVFDVPVPPAFLENEALPGSNALVPAMFLDAPPQVPHGMQDFLPIDREDNACLGCHLIEKDADEDAPLLPESHQMDLRAQPPKALKAVAGARWVCSACHVRLTDARVLPECAPAK